MCRFISWSCVRVHDMPRGHHGRVSRPRAVRFITYIQFRGAREGMHGSSPAKQSTYSITVGCTRPRNSLAAHPKFGQHESILIHLTHSRELVKAVNSVSVLFRPRRYLVCFVSLSDRCMTMAELALVAEINGDATDYTYGGDPSEGSTWDAHRIFG